MRFKEHCAETEEKLGADFAHVHRWLDECAWGGGVFNPYHRMYRHHQAGIEEVRRRWGDKAAEAARLHILADEGTIVADEQEYRKLFIAEPINTGLI